MHFCVCLAVFVQILFFKKNCLFTVFTVSTQLIFVESSGNGYIEIKKRKYSTKSIFFNLIA